MRLATRLLDLSEFKNLYENGIIGCKSALLVRFSAFYQHTPAIRLKKPKNLLQNSEFSLRFPSIPHLRIGSKTRLVFETYQFL